MEQAALGQVQVQALVQEQELVQGLAQVPEPWAEVQAISKEPMEP